MITRYKLKKELLESLIFQKATLGWILAHIQEVLGVGEESLLESDRLSDVRVVHLTVNAVSKVRCTHIEAVFNSLALELDGQFCLVGTPDCDLQQDHP